MDSEASTCSERLFSGIPSELFSEHRPVPSLYGISALTRKCSWLRVDLHAVVLPFTAGPPDSTYFAALNARPQPCIYVYRDAVGKDVIYAVIWEREVSVSAKE